MTTVMPVSRTRNSVWTSSRGLGGVEPCRRLVEQQKARLGGECARDLDQAADARGKVGSRRVDPLLDADKAQKASGLVAGLPIFRDRDRQPEHRRRESLALVSLPADHDVLARGHRLEELSVLEGARDARDHRVSRSAADKLDAVEQDRALVRPIEPGECVEQRGLAGAVGSDERLDGALEHVERDIVDGGEPSEALGDVAHLQKSHAVSAPLRRRRHRPASPPGANTITRTIASP